MHTNMLSRGTTTLATVLLLAIAMLACSAGAQAAPGTVTGANGLSLTVDDTAPAPGQRVTFDWTYTIAAGDTAPSAALTLGGNVYNGAFGFNLGDLSLGSSCGGDLSNCQYDPLDILTEFHGDVPTGPLGRVLTGTADFVVSPTATIGETIAVFGGHSNSNGESNTATTDRLRLVVTAPPTADLGIGLTATAAGLLTSHVDYDAAVTNNGPDAATSATITTQLPTQATGITSSTCTYASATHRASCPIGTLADGATTHATFTATFGLLTIGLPLHATATRTASAPTDPNAANDSDSADCTAITSLLIGC